MEDQVVHQLNTWCSMTNHILLMVVPGEDVGTDSELMKRLAGRQAALVNKQENRSGSLWEGRFKVSPMQGDNYLLACCRYVDMNPVRANMVVGPRQSAIVVCNVLFIFSPTSIIPGLSFHKSEVDAVPGVHR